MPGDNGVVVTLADIYKQLVSLTTRVDAALARADRADQIIAEHEAELRPLAAAAERLTDHEGRLRTLERGRWPLPALTILIALASLAVAVAVALTGK